MISSACKTGSCVCPPRPLRETPLGAGHGRRCNDQQAESIGVYSRAILPITDVSSLLNLYGYWIDYIQRREDYDLLSSGLLRLQPFAPPSAWPVFTWFEARSSRANGHILVAYLEEGSCGVQTEIRRELT